MTGIVTTGAATTTRFTVDRDTFVTSQYANAVRGSQKTIRASAGKNTRVGLLHFTVSGVSGTITNATLRLQKVSSNGAARVYATTPFAESITYKGYQAANMSMRQLASIPTSKKGTIDINVTSAVTGNGQVSLAIQSTSDKATNFASREAGLGASLAVITETAVGSTTTMRATTTTTRATTTTTRPTTTTTTTRATTTTTSGSTSGLAPLPASWPTTFELGSADSPGGAAALRTAAPFKFRYQYLAGGVNTGGGWETWNANGDFVKYYIQDSRNNNMIPVFSYYEIFQSNPGVSSGEFNGVYNNLNNTSTMAAYYNNLKLFFQKATEGGGPVVLHLEPDMSAFLQQRATGDNATTVPASVSSSGQADVAGLPNNLAGFAQAVVKLRNTYGRNVLLGYHFSTWGTGQDIIYSDPSDTVVASIGVRTANFYKSMNAKFDIAFTDIADRDAAFKQIQYGDNNAWWNAADYHRSAVFINSFNRTANLRTVIWQIPLGNTKMRAVDNTWDHYQDNKVETVLDDPTNTAFNAYRNAGVVALLFGRGAGGPTCACDAHGDGITNPAPINGNNRMSLNADDDGGYFKEQAAKFYNNGKPSLP